MAELTGQSRQGVLDQAIEDRQRRLYLDGVNADYAAINMNPKAWVDLQQEIEAWDETNLDGIGKA